MNRVIRNSFILVAQISAILFFCAICESSPKVGLWKDLDLNEARISDYQGLVEVARGGEPVKVRKNTALMKTDEVVVYYDSYLELYFGNKKENILRIEGENTFILADVLKTPPYGFEVRYNPRNKSTETVFIFSEKNWSTKYLELLQQGEVPYTVVFVREGVVATEGLDVANPKEVLVKQGQMTYVFRGKDPFAAMAWEEYIDMCIENCWGEW